MRLVPLLALVAALAASAPASAAIVFSDNFDSYSPASSVPWSGGGVWTTGNSVDLIKSGEYNLTCADGSGNCVDLSGDHAGSISQSITLAAGVYTLKFAYTGNQLDAFGGPWPQVGFTASVGAFNTHIGPLANNSSVFQTYTGNFTTAGGPVTLSFVQDSGGDQYRGSILDNVLITAVPEPSTWAMMIAGFGLIGGAMRRRRSQVVTTVSCS